MTKKPKTLSVVEIAKVCTERGVPAWAFWLQAGDERPLTSEEIDQAFVRMATPWKGD